MWDTKISNDIADSTPLPLDGWQAPTGHPATLRTLMAALVREKDVRGRGTVRLPALMSRAVGLQA